MANFGQAPFANPALAGLFNTAPVNPQITKGSLIIFNYSYWIHDPYPLVIVSDMTPGVRLRGVNLHYLTFNYIKDILLSPMAFSYQSIKPNRYLTDAFRTYKWSGIKQIKKLDTNFILSVMKMARSFDPAQVNTMRETIRQQLARPVNASADSMINPQQGQPPQIGI